MSRYVAFLRAINVGGRVVRMERLRDCFCELGFTEVSTFIASGNVRFTAGRTAPRSLERKIEACLQDRLGYEVATFLRSEAEIAAIAAYQAFSATEVRKAAALCVGFLAEPLDPAGLKAVEGFTTEVDRFKVHGREIYWLCRTRQSDSKFNNTRLERAIRGQATFRNVRTILRLAAQ